MTTYLTTQELSGAPELPKLSITFRPVDLEFEIQASGEPAKLIAFAAVIALAALIRH